MDILAYTYNGNQLTTVNDTGDKAAGFLDGYTAGSDYVYDANGNLKTDKNYKISSISYNVLNKPDAVTFENGNKIIFKYDASGAKLWMEYRVGTAQTLAWRYDYVGPFVYRDNSLQSIAHEQGRIIKHASSFEYQYHITDHLGNIRLTFTSAPELNQLMASASSAESQVEESQFMKLGETRAVVHPSLNHTEGESPEAIRLNGGRGIKDGPGTMLKVMPGDTVRMRVFAKYLDMRKYNANAAASTVLAMIASPGTAVSLGEGAIAEGISHGALGGVAGGVLASDKKSAPKAYLNYLLFDKDMKEVGRGAVQVSELAAVTEKSIGAPHEELNMEVVAPQEGYLLSYLSHEEEQNMDVYFDDFSLTLAGGPIVQVDDFYPYGMTFNREATESAVLNRYLYQGKEKVSDDTDWYDFHARLYSPALGRFLGVDPAGQFANPYNGMGNNPVIGVDPDGEFVFTALALLIPGAQVFLPIAIGADIGAVTGGIRGARNSDIGFWGGAWRGATVGAVGGALSMVGGGTFVANVAWGMGQGALTGGLDAALWGNDIGRGMLYGAAIGGAFATASSGLESIKNYRDGYGFGTDVGRFNDMAKDAVSNGVVDPIKAQRSLDFWQNRFDGPNLNYTASGSPNTSITGRIEIANANFQQGPGAVKRAIAHEHGHYINNINWDNGTVGGTVSNPKWVNLDRTKFGGDGIFGYNTAIKRAGNYHVGYKAISNGASNGFTSPNVSVAWQSFGLKKWWYMLPRRFSNGF